MPRESNDREFLVLLQYDWAGALGITVGIPLRVWAPDPETAGERAAAFGLAESTVRRRMYIVAADDAVERRWE